MPDYGGPGGFQGGGGNPGGFGGSGGGNRPSVQNRPNMLDIAGPVAGPVAGTTTPNQGSDNQMGIVNPAVMDLAIQESLAAFNANLANLGQNQAPVAAAPEVEPEEEQKTTNSIIEAIFNKNLKFEYDPVKDYVNRVYGRLNPVAKKRLLQKVGYAPDMSLSEAVSDFEGFLNEYGQDLYDAGNLQLKDFKNPFEGLELKAPTIPSTVGGIYDAVVGGMTLPYTQAPLAFLSGNLPGMFLSLALGKGDFQLDEAGNIVGDIANLQNAPQNYIDAVIDQQGGLTNEQVAQISMGEQLAAEQQQASGGPFVPPSTSLAEEGAASAPDPQQPAPTDPAPVDLDAVYSGLSDAEKATVDKIVEMDDYDLPYALTYVLYGGPLF